MCFIIFPSTGSLHVEVAVGPVDIDEDDDPSLTFSPSVLKQIDEGPIFAGTRIHYFRDNPNSYSGKTI